LWKSCSCSMEIHYICASFYTSNSALVNLELLRIVNEAHKRSISGIQLESRWGDGSRHVCEILNRSIFLLLMSDRMRRCVWQRWVASFNQKSGALLIALPSITKACSCFCSFISLWKTRLRARASSFKPRKHVSNGSLLVWKGKHKVAQNLTVYENIIHQMFVGIFLLTLLLGCRCVSVIDEHMASRTVSSTKRDSR
jgi:hypothetical protein